MSQDITPVFKTIDYTLALGEIEVTELLDAGYEPHGSAFLDDGTVVQPMVKRELMSTEEYAEMMIKMLKVLPIVMKKAEELGIG